LAVVEHLRQHPFAVGGGSRLAERRRILEIAPIALVAPLRRIARPISGSNACNACSAASRPTPASLARVATISPRPADRITSNSFIRSPPQPFLTL
jgi:hypothetical protein